MALKYQQGHRWWPRPQESMWLLVANTGYRHKHRPRMQQEHGLRHGYYSSLGLDITIALGGSVGLSYLYDPD